MSDGGATHMVSVSFEVTSQVIAAEFATSAPVLELGALSIGAPVPVIPSNYGLITWNGSYLTVS